MIAYTKNLAKQLTQLKKKEVAVGLPVEKSTGKVYEDGSSIIEVGIQHEYGIFLPRRSFLRLPLKIKEKELNKTIKSQFNNIITKGKKTEKALGLIGLKAYNIIQEAFATGGFGQWPALSAITIEAKQSSKILIDTGRLKNSVTWVVRNAS